MKSATEISIVRMALIRNRIVLHGKAPSIRIQCYCLYYKVSTLYNIQIASSCIKVKKGKNTLTTTGPSMNGNNHLTLSPSLSKPLLYPPISSCPPPSISKSNQTPLPSVSRGIPPTYHIKL